MKAAICTAYGGPDVVHVREVPAPVPRAGEVLVRIHASTVASGDCRVRASNFPRGFWLPARAAFGFTRPRRPILGTDFAGTIAALGPGVVRFREGDAVFGMSGMRFGCHAEFVVLRDNGAMAAMPAGFSFEDAAAIPFGATTALNYLRDRAKLQRGERVLVNGAAGAVGSAAVQLAKHFGAHVTGVCSAAKAETVRALGADEIVDHAQADFTVSGNRWDVILDTVGNAGFARCRNALPDGGRLLLVAAGLDELLMAPIQSRTSGRIVAAGPAPERAEDLALLKEFCESGALRPVIDSRYPLARIADAHARADTGRKTGSVVVTIPLNS